MTLRSKLLIVAAAIAASLAVVYAVTQTWVDGNVFAGVGDNGVAGGPGGYQVYPNNGGGMIEFVSDPAYLTQVNAPNFTTGCAFNPAKDFLYTTEFNNGRLAVYSNLTPHSLSTIITQRAQPESIVFHPDGRFFVGGPGVPNFEEYSAAGVLLAVHNLTNPDATQDATGGTDWLDLAADGTTMFIADEGLRIMKFDLVTNTQLPDFTVLPEPGGFALRVLPSGGVAVAAGNMIRQFNSSGAQVATYDVTGENRWFALNIDPDGASFWSGGIVSGRFYKFPINPAGGTNLDTQVVTVDTGLPGRLAGLCVRGEFTAPSSCVIPPDASAISNVSWNKWNVPAGTTPVVWVNAQFRPKGVPTAVTSTVAFTGVSLVLNGTSYPLPDGLVTFDPAAPLPSTTVFNAGLNRWETTINPNSISDENFFVGAAIPFDATLTGNAKATMMFTTQTSNQDLSFSWQWSAAAYTFWPTANWNLAGVQAYHGNGKHAGSPTAANVLQSLIQGPRGGGGSNFTGSWSATGKGKCPE